jgi:O-acetyl-ADP-ribose deacetylase (regulator of RNase III)
MIIKVKGDILQSRAQAIAHGIAPYDHFNQGLALQLRGDFPAMAKDFRHYCHGARPKAGEIWMWAGPERIVINLMVQNAAQHEDIHPEPASLHNVDIALKALRKLIEEENISSIALPRLATGVGGLEWVDVEKLIVRHLGGMKIPVVIYETYQKDVKAEEGLLQPF